MTENKRFKNVEEKLDWGTIQYFTYDDEKITDDEIENLVNQLLEQNEQLKSENEKYKQFFNIPVKDDGSSMCIMEMLEENEQLKKGISLFKGEDARHYQRWVNQIKKYLDESNPDFEYDEDFIIKIALSYTLQSLRNGESLKRFQWEYKELEE